MKTTKTRRYKKLTDDQVAAIEAEVKSMLHCHRDMLRNRWRYAERRGMQDVASNPKTTTFDCREGYYGEAFGIMRGLVTLGYGYFGSDNLNATQEYHLDNPRLNCKWWFSSLCRQVLAEEHFHGNHECDWCLQKYGYDDAGRTRS